MRLPLNRNRSRGAGLWLALGFALLLAGTAWSESTVFHLRNGDRITGAVIAENDDLVTIRTVWLQYLILRTTEITRREPAAEAVLPTPDAPPAPPAPAESAATAPPPPEPAVAPKPPPAWAADVQLGVDLARSSTDRELYYGRAKVTYLRDRFRNVFDYSTSYGETDERVTANRMDGSVKTDWDLNRRTYIYNLAGAGYDEIRRIDLRVEAGPGGGYRVVQRPAFVFNVELGGIYQDQQRADGTRLTELLPRLAEDATWRVFERLTVDEKVEFFPRSADLGDFRLRAEANVRYALTQSLSLNLTVLNLYETDPAAGVSENDFQFRSSVGVKF